MCQRLQGHCQAPVLRASEASGPFSGSRGPCLSGSDRWSWTLWLPGDFTRLVREGLKRDIQIDMTFCMDDPFTQSQDVLDSIIKTRIYAQTGLLFKPSPLKRLPLHLVQCHQRDRVLFWKTPHADYVGPRSVTKSKPITPCDGPCLATRKRFWEKWGGGREGDSASHSNSSKSRRMLHSSPPPTFNIHRLKRVAPAHVEKTGKNFICPLHALSSRLQPLSFEYNCLLQIILGKTSVDEKNSFVWALPEKGWVHPFPNILVLFQVILKFK